MKKPGSTLKLTFAKGASLKDPVAGARVISAN